MEFIKIRTLEDWPGGPGAQSSGDRARPAGVSVSEADTGKIAAWCWGGRGQAALAIGGRDCCYQGEETLLGPPSEPQTEGEPNEANLQEVNPFFHYLHLAEPHMESSGKKHNFGA